MKAVRWAAYLAVLLAVMWVGTKVDETVALKVVKLVVVSAVV